MSNSKLVTYTKWSPNCTKPRNSTIKGVAIHCMAGNLSVETCGQVFQSRDASSHYGIGSDGRIAQYVDEKNRAWCTSHTIDHSIITIEVANTKAAHPWPVSDAAYKSLINLLVDICKRNGIKKLLWQGNKSLMGQWDKQNMVVHRWTAAKACPGDYLYNLHWQIAKEVNERLDVALKPKEDELNMTKAEFLKSLTNEEAYQLVAKANEYVAGLSTPTWAKEVWDKATASGLVDGSRPESELKRDEFVTVLDRLGLVK